MVWPTSMSALAALLSRAEAAGLLAAPDTVTTTAELGRGGNGSVTLVRRGSGARAAFKQALFTGFAHVSVIEQLLTEVEHLRDCEPCERVVRCYGLLVAPGVDVVGFLMEDFGVSLARALHDAALRPPAESERRTVARHIAEALAYLHDTALMCHLDVKPENVLVAPERGWAAKLADFGGATRFKALRVQALVDRRSMTAPYVAPECLRRELPDDAVALQRAAQSLDVYAYGLTLCMLWLRTGDALARSVRHPFWLLEREARLDEELCAAVSDPFTCLLTRRVGHGGEQPGLPPGTPEDVRDLMQSCWAHDPIARPSANDVAACQALACAQSWRAIMTVTYTPHIAGDTCYVRVSLAPPESVETPALAGEESLDSGFCRVSFSCMLTTGTECAVVIAPFTAGAHAHDGQYLSTARAVLLPFTPTLMDALAAPRPLAECALTLSVTRGQDDSVSGSSALQHLAACVLLQRRHVMLAMPDVRLGTLSLTLSAPIAEVANCSTSYDVMLSYCDAETGVARGGDGFALSVCDALRAKGYTVYLFAERVREGKAWQDVRAFGLTRCAAFVALCSPTYGCLDHSPWSANELRFAFAERVRRGAPRFVALWHTGKAPPGPGQAAPAVLFCGQSELPDAVVPPPSGKPGAVCHFEDVMNHLFAALRMCGVHHRSELASPRQ